MSSSGRRPVTFGCIALAALAAQAGIARRAAGQTAPVADPAGLATLADPVAPAAPATRVDPAAPADPVAPAAPAQPLDVIGLELENPVGSVFSVASEMEYLDRQGYINGASDFPEHHFLIRPSFPFRLKNGRAIVVRGTIPISFGEPSYPAQYQDFADWRIRQFAYLLPDDAAVRRDHGFMDDIGFDVAYGGVNDNGFIKMFGAAGVLPTSTDGTTARHQNLLGPEVAFGKVTSWGVIGAWATHLVSVSTASERQPPYDTRMTSLKVFFSYELGNGWQITSNPVIEYDWEALDDNELLLPIGGGFAKTTSIRNMPLRLSLEIYHYVESPAAFGPDWLVRFGVTPVLKSSNRNRPLARTSR